MSNAALEEFFGQPETVVKLAGALTQSGTELMRLRNTLDGRVKEVVPASWQGPASTAFQQTWTKQSTVISDAADMANRLGSALQTLGSELQAAKQAFRRAELHAAASHCLIVTMDHVQPLRPDAACHAAARVIQAEVQTTKAMAVVARNQARMELSIIGRAGWPGIVKDLAQGGLQGVGELAQLVNHVKNLSHQDWSTIGLSALHGVEAVGTQLWGAMETLGKFSEERALVDPEGFERDVRQAAERFKETPLSETIRGGTKLGVDLGVAAVTGGAGAKVFKEVGSLAARDAVVMGVREGAEVGARDAAALGVREGVETGAGDIATTGAREAAVAREVPTLSEQVATEFEEAQGQATMAERAEGMGMSEVERLPGAQPAQLEAGNLVHANPSAFVELPAGVQREVEFTLKETTVRVDAIDFENRVVYEIKPNTPASIAQGELDLKTKLDVINRYFRFNDPGSMFTGQLRTYDPALPRQLLGPTP